MRSPSSGSEPGEPSYVNSRGGYAIFSWPLNSSTVRLSGSIERKSRTAGLSSPIVTSTEVDAEVKRTTVPTTWAARTEALGTSLGLAADAEAAAGGLGDDDGCSTLGDGPNVGAVVAPALPQAVRVNMAAAIAMTIARCCQLRG